MTGTNYFLGAIISLSIGGLLSAWAMYITSKSLLALRWPSVQGQLIDAGVNEERDEEGDLIAHVHVRYRYSVRGLTFQSSRLAFGFGEEASPWLAWRAFTRGVREPLIVYFNPSDPAEAVLAPGLHAFHIMLLAGGVLFLAFGLAGL